MHTHEMLDLRDHAAGRWIVRQLRHTPDAIEPKPDQCLALAMMPPRRTAGLLDLDNLVALAHFELPARLHAPQSAAWSPSPPSRRRACSADTLMLRRSATERG